MSPRTRHAGERAGDADDDGDGANGDASSVLSPFLSRPRPFSPAFLVPPPPAAAALRRESAIDERFAKVETEKEGARALLFFRAVGAVALREMWAHISLEH